MLRHSYFGLAFTLLPLWLAIGTHPMPGQTMSFLRQFTTPGMVYSTAVAADTSGIYVLLNRPASPREFRAHHRFPVDRVSGNDCVAVTRRQHVTDL